MNNYKNDPNPNYKSTFDQTGRAVVDPNPLQKPFIPTTVATNVPNAVVKPKGTFNEAAAREAIKQKYRGEKFILIDTNGDGVFDAIDIIPVDWQGLADAKADSIKHAGYYEHVQSAKNLASVANAGNSADQIAAAVRVAGERAHLSWKGAVPPKTSAELTDEAKVKEAKAVEVAIAAELASPSKF